MKANKHFITEWYHFFSTTKYKEEWKTHNDLVFQSFSFALFGFSEISSN